MSEEVTPHLHGVQSHNLINCLHYFFQTLIPFFDITVCFQGIDQIVMKMSTQVGDGMDF